MADAFQKEQERLAAKAEKERIAQELQEKGDIAKKLMAEEYLPSDYDVSKDQGFETLRKAMDLQQQMSLLKEERSLRGAQGVPCARPSVVNCSATISRKSSATSPRADDSSASAA